MSPIFNTLQTTAADTAADSSRNASEPKKDLASKEAFLTLLVAQIKNQNPLEPADGLQFVTQLAQFSDLEQTLGMRDELVKIRTLFEQLGGAPNQPETKP